MIAATALACLLAASEADLGDERTVLEALARLLPGEPTPENLLSVMEEARAVRATMVELGGLP